MLCYCVCALADWGIGMKTNNWFVQVLVIVDAKPKALGLPTDAYYSVEEVHDVSHCGTPNP